MHTGVYLSLKGVLYANYSVTSISEIGETDRDNPSLMNNAIQCITDRKPCCRGGNRAGEWFFPNGSVVPVEGLFYRNRGPDDGAVNLNRANTNVMMPTSLFCCIVPDATGINQTIFADISELAIYRS